MTGHGAKLSHKQELAIAALLVHPTVGAAAHAVHISESTLLRWLKRADFRAQYYAARQEAIHRAIGQLQQTASEAVTALRAVLNDTAAPTQARVAAAKTVLEMVLRVDQQRSLPENEALEIMRATVDATTDVLDVLGVTQHEAWKEIAARFKQRLPAGFPVEQIVTPNGGASHGPQ
jgi:hypothetical protein